MRPEADGMMLVRAELCERLMSLQAAARRLSARDFTRERRRDQAARRGLRPDAGGAGRRGARAGGGGGSRRLPARALSRPAPGRDRLRAARGERRPRRCSPRSRSGSAAEPFGRPAHQLRRRRARRMGRQDPVARHRAGGPLPAAAADPRRDLRRRARQQPDRRVRRRLRPRHDHPARRVRCWSRSPWSSPEWPG